MNMTLRKSNWWKEPMVWLIIALPLTAVIASIVTVIIASRTADALVQGDFKKEGLTLQQHTERDQRAAQLGLSARIQLHNNSVRAELGGQLESAPQRIMLLLAHPTLASRDVFVTLGRLERNVYSGDVPDLHGVNWQVQLEPADQSWQLSGRWDVSASDALQLTAHHSELPTHP